MSKPRGHYESGPFNMPCLAMLQTPHLFLDVWLPELFRCTFLPETVSM
jgi:hypothetical protein